MFKEIEFAQGDTIETRGMRVTYKCLNQIPPHQKDRFVRVYKTYGNQTTLDISMTPEETRWLYETLGKLLEGVPHAR